MAGQAAGPQLWDSWRDLQIITVPQLVTPGKRDIVQHRVHWPSLTLVRRTSMARDR